MHNVSHLILSNYQLWSVVIGGLVPLGAYVVNSVIPGVSEPVKAFVHVALATIAAALYTALATNVFGANTATLELVITAIASALASHHLLWKPSTVAQTLRVKK